MMWYATVFMVFCAARTHSSGTTFYLDFEHPNLTYWNPKYYEYVNLTARRLSRRDPIHYVSIYSKTLADFDNDILVEVYVYEFLSNEYRRSFIEAHYKLCDAMKKEKAFLPYFMKFLPVKTCPFPKGQYHFKNVALPNMPLLQTFPFSKGRVFVNVSNWRTRDRIAESQIDAVIKERLQ